jgi:hypothetical protein
MSRPCPQPPQASIRFRIEPRDVPMSKAARRLHLTLDEFRSKLPSLLQRGFPPPDPTTGHFYLPAIDKWMEARPGLTTANGERDDSALIDERLEKVPWGT